MKKKEENEIFEIDISKKNEPIKNNDIDDVLNLISVENMIALKEESAKIARSKKHNIDNSVIKLVTEPELTNIPNEVLENVTIKQTQNLDTSKELLIEQLRKAQKDHLDYYKSIYILIQLNANNNNISLNKPINYTMCDFGKWYYSTGQSLIEFEEFDKIESLHVFIHNYYLKIYKLFSVTLKSSFFKTVKKLENERLKKAEKLVVILDANSKQLMSLLDNVILKIEKMNSQELESILS